MAILIFVAAGIGGGAFTTCLSNFSNLWCPGSFFGFGFFGSGIILSTAMVGALN
jgi:hypothetical protein